MLTFVIGGKGYVSMSEFENAGEVPDSIRQMSSDGSGRFSIAVFHQLHCLVCMASLTDG